MRSWIRHSFKSAAPGSLSKVSSPRAIRQEASPSSVAARAMFSAQQKASATLYRKFFGPKTAQTVGAP